MIKALLFLCGVALTIVAVCLLAWAALCVSVWCEHRAMARELKQRQAEGEVAHHARCDIRHQLKEGFSPAEVSRNLRLPLVIVQHEQELMP